MSESAAKPPTVLAQVESLIGSALVDVERILLEELASTNPYVNDILQHVTRFRGKRLRPMLLLLTADASGGVRNEHAVLAAVVEMIHLATLVHDDVLDEAHTRRHVATVNARWNNETSVLFGDFLFTHAFHLASSLETTHACRLIGRTTNLVCEGELSQVKERGNLDLSEEAYFKIIDGKTAELCAVCGQLGAYYAKAEPAVITAMEQYARSLGLAFQIADDVLDLVGTEDNTGKTLGSDLIKQKLTLPIIRMLATLPDAEAVKVRGWLAQPGPQTRELLLPLLEKTDALNWATAKAIEHSQHARAQLEAVPPSASQRILAEIAEFAVRRQF